MKIALVHDYLNEFGGAERVLKVLSEMYPEAPIYTIFKVEGSNAAEEFKDKKIIESWFGKIPFCHKLISPLRFLLPAIWGSFDFSEYDLVISSAAWAVTKGFKRGKRTKEICYLHTPPRWLYGYDESRSWNNKWYGWAIKVYALVVSHFLRQYDYKRAQNVDLFIVNSKNVGKRVEKFYRRNDYKVVYPPVNVERYKPLKDVPLKGRYYLTGGRMTSAKNFDLIIKAFNKLKIPLKIYGGGILEEKLKSLASENTRPQKPGASATGGQVEFVGKVSDSRLVELYQSAKAFIAAQKDEDFGMTVIEAMAAGIPVIAYRGGGYEESVIEGKTGIFFDKLTVESLIKAVTKFEKNKWDKKLIQKHSKKFSKENFVKKIKKVIRDYA